MKSKLYNKAPERRKRKEGCETMKVTKIKLGLDDVNAFVNAATECDFDIDVNYNRVIIDAKSILGVLGLDLGRVLTVTCHGESQKFDNFLQQYAVA